MKKVLVVREENHGTIGVAKTVADAVKLLIAKGWLNGSFTIFSQWAADDSDYKNPYVPITDEEYGLGEKWEEKLKNYPIDDFNDLFWGTFYLEEHDFYD